MFEHPFLLKLAWLIRQPIRSWFACLLLSMLIIACSSDSQQENEEQKPTEQKTKLSAIAFDPALPWLNVPKPLTMDDLIGKVIILDFWTYGCINCIHVLADLRKLQEKYGDHLAIIGVHTPKFENEKNIETLRNIVVRYGIDYPVVNDVGYLLGTYYGMRAWPTQIMIDPEGFVLGKVVGEDHYELFDKLIGQLVDQHRDRLNPTPISLALEREKLAESLLAAPGKIAVDDRFVAISDTLHHRIIVANHHGKIEKIYGGTNSGREDGSADLARFNAPQGLAFSGEGLFVADTGNHLIRYIDLVNENVRTVAGSGALERQGAGKFNALSVGLASPWGLALHGNTLYIAMAGSHQIWHYNAVTGELVLWAGTGREGIQDGPAKVATFSQPSGLSIVGEWLYVADAEDSAVRRIHLDEDRVETLIGTGLFDFGDRDGPIDQAQLQHLLGVAALNSSKVVIADTYNHKLKLLDLESGVVVTLVGNGRPGNALTQAGEAQLNEPGGVAILGQQVLVADTNNHRILAYDLDTKKTRVWTLIPTESTETSLD